MKTTMDSAGRLVIPKEIRREAGIKAGTPLEVRVKAGVIEIDTLPMKARLKKRGKLLIAVPEAAVPVLTEDVVEETRRKIRRERGSRD